MPPQTENNTPSLQPAPRGHVYLLILTFLLILTGVFGVWYFLNTSQSDEVTDMSVINKVSGWKTYTNIKNGFSFKYPETLTYEGENKIENNILEIGYASPHILSNPLENGLKADLVFNIFQNPTHLSMKDYFTSQNHTFLPNVFTSNTAMKSTTIDGRNAVYYDVQSEYDFKEIIVDDHDKFIRIQDFNNFTAPILESFKFISTSTPVSTLPPDPGATGKATLAGIDSDKDGVRDDIQRYIFFQYPQSEKMRAAMTQFYTALQTRMLVTVSRKDISKTYDAQECIYYVAGINDASRKALSNLEAQIVNTPSRLDAWMAVQDAGGGQVYTVLDNYRDGCTFNPDIMKN